MSAKPKPHTEEVIDPVEWAKRPWEERLAEIVARGPVRPEDAPVMAETEEERRAVEEARASLARGDRTYSSEEIKAAIEEMRRRQEGG